MCVLSETHWRHDQSEIYSPSLTIMPAPNIMDPAHELGLYNPNHLVLRSAVEAMGSFRKPRCVDHRSGEKVTTHRAKMVSGDKTDFLSNDPRSRAFSRSSILLTALSHAFVYNVMSRFSHRKHDNEKEVLALPTSDIDAKHSKLIDLWRSTLIKMYQEQKSDRKPIQIFLTTIPQQRTIVMAAIRNKYILKNEKRIINRIANPAFKTLRKVHKDKLNETYERVIFAAAPSRSHLRPHHLAY